MLKSLKKLSQYLKKGDKEDTKEKKESEKRDARKTRPKSKEKTNFIKPTKCQHHWVRGEMSYLNP